MQLSLPCLCALVHVLQCDVMATRLGFVGLVAPKRKTPRGDCFSPWGDLAKGGQGLCPQRLAHAGHRWLVLWGQNSVFHLMDVPSWG